MVQWQSEFSGTAARCAWIHAWRRPSRARYASAATAFADMPRSGATSAGFMPSTSQYQSTSCHRVGRVRNAFAVRERSSASRPAASVNAGSSMVSASSIGVSRARRPQEAATLRTVVKR